MKVPENCYVCKQAEWNWCWCYCKLLGKEWEDNGSGKRKRGCPLAKNMTGTKAKELLEKLVVEP